MANHNKQTEPKESKADPFKELLEPLFKNSNFNNDSLNSERAKKSYEKLETHTTRSLTDAVTFQYYMLSITAACIGFAISLTVNKKFTASDSILMISLISWITSFVLSIVAIQRSSDIIMNFNLFLLGEISSMQNVADKHKKIAEELADKSSKIRTHPLIYFLLGILVFIIWYITKISTN